MSTLGATAKERAISRVVFYLLVLLSTWATSRLLPDQQALEEQKWAEMGVAPPVIGVPAHLVDQAAASR